ncbi:hypothetical protein RY831_31005 [Noviherbaspirillum sp. CPCC 100848]|uniref:Uncharacterized protein n=1 Tax=Noviherbaspirillum album TaxID=3080276 RepID=A0ABU6JIU0_9BURK|nr:hypothetical protein [Noviherbaspirillum sp. CPCC 100848]MEC4723571.1 hypothetical protein [Noviherbaspirillum sp. CPCC 100848]
MLAEFSESQKNQLQVVDAIATVFTIFSLLKPPTDCSPENPEGRVKLYLPSSIARHRQQCQATLDKFSFL